jgi:3-oxoacyl-[acyl-carrier protein] reductase
MDLGLTDRVALVSGASGEIGQAICAVLLDEGAIVAALHRGTRDPLTSLRERAGSGGSEQKIVPVVAELTDGAAIDTAMQQVLDRCGRIDILVNNAAVTIEGPFLAVPESEARELAEVNVWAAYRLMQLALKPMMRARRGVVVNVSSVVASYGGRGVSAYAMTKAALETLTRVLALEMAPKGVRLNAVAPGLVTTSMSHVLRQRLGAELLGKIPLGRAGMPEEVARAVAWLASDRTAGYMTGQVITIDGGYSL